MVTFITRQGTRLIQSTANARALLTVVLLLGAFLLKVLLADPVRSWIYNTFIPQQNLPLETGTVVVTLISAALIILLIGSVSVWLLRPSANSGRLWIGGLSGVLVGLLVFASVGSWAAGIAAQAPLYAVAMTRDGYNNAEWVLKLAVAVNQTFPATLIAFLLCAGLGGILGGVGGALVSVRGPREEMPDGLPLWTLVSIMAVPLLQITSIVSTVMLMLMGPALTNIFTRYGYEAAWHPEWMAPSVVIPQFIVIVVLLLGLRSWLNRVYLGSEKRTAPHVFLNTLTVNGFFIALGGAAQILVMPDNWWTVAIGIIVSGLGLELIRLSKSISPGTEPLNHQMRWIGAGILSGLLTTVISWMLVATSLSLVLVSVVMIPHLATPDQLPIGLPKLLEILNSASDFMRDSTPLIGLLESAFIGLVISALLVKNVPAFLARAFKTMGRRMLSPLSSRLHSDPARKLAIVTAICFIDLLIVHAPLFTFLGAVAFIQREDLFRVPRWMLSLPIIILALAMVTPFIDLTPVETLLKTSRFDPRLLSELAKMALVISSVIVYHMIALYAPLQQRSIRYIRSTVGLSLAVGAIIFLSKPSVTANGGVSRFDGTRWTAFTLDNSTVGTNLQTEMLLRADGSLWFANSGGTISLYDGEHWTLSALKPGAASTIQADELVNRSVELIEDADHQIWFASDAVMGRIENDPESTGLYGLVDLITPCKEFNQEITLTGCSFVPLSPPSTVYSGYFLHGAEPNRFSNLMGTSGGSLWFIFHGSISHFLERDRFLGYAIPPINASDTDGTNVWFATEYGLYRYHDVLTSEIVSQPDFVLSIPEQVSTVTSATQFVAVDAQGRVWFQTASGLHRLVADDTFETALSQDRLHDLINHAHITSLVSDANGVLWIGSEDGLIRFDPAQDTSEVFTQANSGLAVNRVVDLVVDQEGELIWVSTFRSTQNSSSPWVMIVIGLGIWLLIGFGIWRDYDNTPESGGRKIGKRMIDAPDDLYPQIYNFLALQPDPVSVRTAADQLAQAGLPSGGSALLILSQPLVEPGPQFGHLIEALAADRPRKWAQTLHDQYTILYHAIRTHSIDDIVNLELRASPGHSGAGLRVSTREVTLDGFLSSSLATSTIWQAFHDTSLALSKYAEVSGTGDRLSYLAAALSFIETAQSTASGVPAPDGVALRTVAAHWRQIITHAIHTLSGSADLRLELRTRQIHREANVTLVLKLDNVGQSAAENIRLVLHTNDHFAISGEANRVIDRLSPNRSEIVEFALVPTDAATIRVHFDLLWDDRLTSDKTSAYADEVRFYETSAEFTPIPNPYIVGHPVKQAQMFFGREDVFQFVAQNLSGSVQDRTLVLYGQRRTGKTSLLYQIINGRLGERFIPVLIDMQAIVMMIESTADFLGEILYQLGQSLQEAHIAIDIPVIDSQTQAPLRVFDRFLDALGRVLGERRILLLFDEFELIESKIASGTLDVNLLDYFRSLIQHRDTLVFVFTGTHQLEDMTHDYWSMLFNIALSRKISTLSDAETIALIRRPVAQALAVDDLAIEKIIRLTRGHPYFTQLLCWALVNHCNEKRHNYATINDVNDVLATMLTTGEAHFAYIWQQTDPQEQIILAPLAHQAVGATPQHLIDLLRQQGETSWTTADLIPLLDGLVRREILEIAADGPLHYRYRLDILRLWVGENKPIQGLLERRHLGRATPPL